MNRKTKLQKILSGVAIFLFATLAARAGEGPQATRSVSPPPVPVQEAGEQSEERSSKREGETRFSPSWDSALDALQMYKKNPCSQTRKNFEDLKARYDKARGEEIQKRKERLKKEQKELKEYYDKLLNQNSGLKKVLKPYVNPNVCREVSRQSKGYRQSIREEVYVAAGQVMRSCFECQKNYDEWLNTLLLADEARTFRGQDLYLLCDQAEKKYREAMKRVKDCKEKMSKVQKQHDESLKARLSKIRREADGGLEPVIRQRTEARSRP